MVFWAEVKGYLILLGGISIKSFRRPESEEKKKSLKDLYHKQEDFLQQLSIQTRG